MGWFNIKRESLIAKVIIFVVAIVFGASIIYNFKLLFIWIGIFLLILIVKMDEEIFLLFFIVNVGVGATLNLKYRYFKVTMSDITLLMLTASFALYYLRSKSAISIKAIFIQKEVFLFALFFISALFFGIIHKYSLYNIFQDVKLFFYFFIPYLYLKIKNYCENTIFVKKILLAAIVCSIIVSLQELYHFQQIGIYKMIMNNFGNRDVGISIIIVPIMFVVITDLQNKKILKLNKFIYIMLMALFIIGCALSFTRTVWLQLVITLFLYFIYYIVINRKKIVRYSINIIISSLLLILIINVIPGSYSNLIIRTINERISTLQIFNKTKKAELGYIDTSVARSNNSAVLIERLKSPEAIWGFGLGDTILTYNGLNEMTFVENSYLYYIWKYGLVGSLLLFFFILKKSKQLLLSSASINRVIVIAMLIFIGIGSFSGNLSLYYYMPLVVLYVTLDFKQFRSGLSSTK